MSNINCMPERKYFDADGNPITLYKLVRIDPDWAASRIRCGEQAMAQRDQLLDALKALTERSSDLASQCGYFKNDIKEIFNAQIIIKAVEQSQ